MPVEYLTNQSSSRGKAFNRFRAQDPVTYTKVVKKRVDAKYTLTGITNELAGLIDSMAVAKRVRVKNTSGSTWPAATLLYPDTAKLTTQTTGVASNVPLAGTFVTITIAGTWEVGQMVSVVTGAYTDFAMISSIPGAGSIAVDVLYYDHNLPTVTALPAYEATAADADASAHVEWVIPAAIANGAYGWAYDCYEVTGIDTSLLAAEALLYLSPTAGTYTVTAPTGADQIQQVVGVVVKSHATLGIIYFFPGNKRIQKIGTSFLQDGSVTVAKGGTGLSTFVVGDLLYASGVSALSRLADIAVGNALISGGVGVAPSWGKIQLSGGTIHVNGVLTIANGGTNSATALTGSGSIVTQNGTSIVQGPAGTATTVLHGNAAGLPTYSAVVLTTDVSGTLPIGNGGTNSAAALTGSGSIVTQNGTSIVQGPAGTATTVLHGNAAGLPTYSAVVLTTDVSGILPAANGGTGVNNAGTITNATNTTITGGGTLALGGFTATVPATGTVDLIGTAQTVSARKTHTATPIFSNMLRNGTVEVLCQDATPATRNDGTALVAGDLWWEPDQQILWYWNTLSVSCWLSVQIYSETHSFTGLTANESRYFTPEPLQAAQHDIFVVDISTSTLLSSASASDFWNFTFNRLTAADVVTAIEAASGGTTALTWTISKNTPATRHYDLSVVDFKCIRLDIAKTGAPGNLYGSARINYRLAHT